jgi:hypothetical protein
MEENISFDAEKCCTQFAERQIPQHHFAMLLHLRGGFLCTEESHVKGGEPSRAGNVGLSKY